MSPLISSTQSSKELPAINLVLFYPPLLFLGRGLGTEKCVKAYAANPH